MLNVLSDAVSLRTSRETMALQDETVAEMYDQLAKEYEGKKMVRLTIGQTLMLRLLKSTTRGYSCWSFVGS